MGQIFEIGSEIDVFSTPEELVEKIEYSLVNDRVRDTTVERAFTRAASEYRLPDAITQAVQDCSKRIIQSSGRGLVNRRRNYGLLSDFRMRSCYFCLSKAITFLGRGRLFVSLECLVRFGIQIVKGDQSLLIYITYVQISKVC